jgi:hypothetical protein
MEGDTSVRPRFGVVVGLVELDDGTTRIVIDDVRSEFQCRDTKWTFDCFYTHKQLDTKALSDMSLPDSEYEGLGTAILARLVALKDNE